MENKKIGEFRVIVEGDYASVEEAKHALQDPFIEDFVEEHGRFRINDFENIRVVGGIPLAEMEIGMIENGVFEISCKNSPLILNLRKAEELAETLRRQAMFDEVSVEPLD